MSKISIIIPVKNESKNVEVLTNEILKYCSSLSYEIVFVNDGSVDETEKKLIKLKNKYKNLRLINHQVSFGQSAAIRSGVYYSKNEIIVTMDGDCQNDPEDILKMLKRFNNEKSSMLLIGGVRKVRKDSATKKLGSKFGKFCRKLFLNDDHPDSGCGIKIFHKKLFLKMPYFDHMHRFLPALARREGAKIIAFDVNHRPRLGGNSNYNNLGRLLVGIYDIIGVMWLIKRVPKNFKSTEVE